MVTVIFDVRGEPGHAILENTIAGKAHTMFSCAPPSYTLKPSLVYLQQLLEHRQAADKATLRHCQRHRPLPASCGDATDSCAEDVEGRKQRKDLF